MSIIKRTLSIIMVLAMTLAIVACAAPAAPAPVAEAPAAEAPAAEAPAAPAPAAEAPAADDDFTIAFCDSNSSYPYMVKWEGIITEKCKELGWTLHISDAAGDVSTQNDQIENYCTMGVDAIICVPINVTASVTAMETCKEAGIPVIAVFNHCDVDRTQYPYYVFVGSDNVQAGKLTGEFCASVLPEGADVCVILGRGGINQTADLREGYQLGLFDVRSDINIIDEQNTDDYRADAVDVTENWLTAYQETKGIDCIMGYCDDSALGALQAVQNGGYNPSDFVICGRDGTEATCLEIVKGNITYTLLQDAKGQVAAALEICDHIRQGGTLEGYEDVIIDYIQITKDSVNDILANEYGYTQADIDKAWADAAA